MRPTCAGGLTVILVLAFLLGVASPSQGAPVTFDFTSPGFGFGSSLTFTDPGTGVSVTATPSAANGSARLVYQNGTFLFTLFPGLGVVGWREPFDSPQIDGSPNNRWFGNNAETLTLTFHDPNGTPVILDSVTFGRVGGNDDAKITVGGGGTIFSGGVPGGISSDLGTGTVNSFSGSQDDRTGTSFSITGLSANDDFTITGIQVTRTPEPATMALFAACGIGAVLYRRRRQPA